MNELKWAIRVLTRKCKRCGHTWLLREPVEPRICPKCKTAYWNVKKK